MTTKEKIQILINGGNVIINDHELKEIQRELRAIKKNCTIVLGQIKENINNIKK